MLQQVSTVAPPVQGLNTTGQYAGMPTGDAVDLDNAISSELGLTVRGGWREYATNIDHGAIVKSIFSRSSSPATSVSSPLVGSEMFAATDHGIFNIEGGGDMSALAPSIALSGASDAGYCNAVQFTAAGGGQYLVVCSETDGAFIYDGLTWRKLVVTGVDPGLLVHVCVWKRRLMFTRKSSGEVWFLDAGAISGTALPFEFGPTLRHGGMVLGLANWTMDAGEGLDDQLVVMGSGGDVAIYKGTDPSDATAFEMIGTWYIGQPPVGRRCFTTTGGNVYMLTQYGVIPVAELVDGGLDNILTSGTDNLRQLRKIQSALNSDFQTFLDIPGWQLLDIPSLALLQIARPSASINEHIQYVFQQHSLAWSRILDVPCYCFARRLNELYGSTTDGRVLRVWTGNTDGQKLNGTGATEIRARITPAFNDFGAPAVQKMMHMIRLQWIAKANPSYTVRMNINYELNPVAGTAVARGFVGSLWDQALWDRDVWSGGRAAFGEWRTVRGMGYTLTPTIFLSTTAATTLAAIEYMSEGGGPW